jgi:hypothetical protein
MAEFMSASMRAAGSDLTIAISPLGLIELSDEEFEVHGPRLTRYAQNWAFYLGHHWAYRRQIGEPQLVFNYCAALSDYLTNFTFGKPVQFHSDKRVAHIVPALIDRILSRDNSKDQLFWAVGNLGSVSGDAFVKVAYEPAYVDPAGNEHRGRVRILALNPAFCFPEWAPHDQERMLRFKLKYRFWATAPEGTRQVYTYTEIITDDVIEEYVNDQLIRSNPNPLGEIPVVHIANKPAASSPWGLSDIQNIVALNREYNEKATEISDIINYHCLSLDTEALTRSGWKQARQILPGEQILTLDPVSDTIQWQPAQVSIFPFEGNLIRWSNHIDALSTPNHRWLAERKRGRPANRRYTREIARTSVPEGGDAAIPGLRGKIVVGGGIPAGFSTERKWSDELVETVGWYLTEGCDVYSPSGWHSVSIGQKKPQFITDIRRLAAYWQAEGATFTESKRPNNSGTTMWYLGKGVKEALEAAAPGKLLTPEFLCSLTYHQAHLLHKILLDGDGTRSHGRSVWYQDSLSRQDGYQMLCAMLGIRTSRVQPGVVTEYQRRALDAQSTAATAQEEAYTGEVWCPSVESGIWFARRNGNTYWTGNTSPVTVVTGAKASNLERGANKLWGILQSDAKVYNLEGGSEGLPPALEYLDRIKKAMHEMVGVPENALGEAQPISNTSGVALAIQYMPLMMGWTLKTNQYGHGWKQIMRFALRTLFLEEPDTIFFDPNTDGIIEDPEVQLDSIDPMDPITYDLDIVWPEPLPVDKVIKLNEIMMQMQLGLESKRGALLDLGEQFPDEKRQELFEETMTEAKMDGAARILRAHIDAAIMQLTGMVPGPDGTNTPADPGGNTAEATTSTTTTATGTKTVKKTNPVALPPAPALAGLGDITGIVGKQGGDILNQLVTQAYGTKIPQARQIDQNSNTKSD